MLFLDARLSPYRTKRGNKSPGMEIIPLVVVLLCAPWLATTLDLRIPGLGKMSLQFIRETTAPGDLEIPTEEQKTADDQTTLASQATQMPANEKVTSDKPGNQTDAAEADPTTTVGNEAVTEGTTKELQENAKTTAKENEKTTQAGNVEPKATTEAVTKAETGKIDATTEAQAPAKNTVNKEEKEESAASTVKNSKATTEATTVKDEQKQNENVTTPSPGKKLDVATTNEAVTEGTTMELQENAKTTAKENEKTTQAGNAEPKATTEAVTKAETGKIDATTEAQAPAKNTVNKEEKEESATSTVKNSEATTEAITVKDEQKQNEKELDAATTATSATEEDDDFDMSDVWEDVEYPSDEFGREYDVDPKLLDSGSNNALGGDDDFQPKLELPQDMTKDMFYDVPPNNGTKDVEPNKGGFFDRLKKIFGIGNLVEQLDTIPGKVQSLMDQFRQKKSNGLRSLREKLDSSAESIGNTISEALAKLHKPKQETPPECLGRIRENFKQYEAALQDGIEPCLEKAQSIFGKQDGVLKGAMERFSQTLSDMMGCAKKLEGATINTLVTSIVNVGSCTKNNLQSKIGQALQPQMQRLSELIQRQGTTLKGNIDAAGECIGRKLQLSKFQNQRGYLIAEGQKCLKGSDNKS